LTKRKTVGCGLFVVGNRDARSGRKLRQSDLADWRIHAQQGSFAVDQLLDENCAIEIVQPCDGYPGSQCRNSLPGIRARHSADRFPID
jgi:hypothetical protein